MAIRRQSVIEDLSALVPICEGKAPKVTKGTKYAFDAALAEFNEATGEKSDLEFLMEDIMIEATKVLKDEAAKAKKEKEPKPRQHGKPDLKPVEHHQQSA